MVAYNGNSDLMIGGTGFVLKPGSYRKRSQPTMGGTVFSTGDPDWTKFGPEQHWVQADWRGGTGQVDWVDPAMYDSGVGLGAGWKGRLQCTRGFVHPPGKNYVLDGRGGPFRFVTWRGALYAVSTNPDPEFNDVWGWTAATDTWNTAAGIFPDAGAITCALVAWDKFYLGCAGNASAPRVYYTTDMVVWIGIMYPASIGAGVGVTAMEFWNDRIYVAFSDGQIWRLKSDGTWDGTTVFYKLMMSSAKDFEGHLGFLYITTTNGVIYRTDGSTTGEVWRGPTGSVGYSLTSYDGRLYCQASETDGGGTQNEFVLYQLSGSAMTELRRYRDSSVIVPGFRMFPFGGKLYYPASDQVGMGSGYGVMVYDSVEDSHEMFAISVQGTGWWQVEDIMVAGGYMFMSTYMNGVFRTSATMVQMQADRDVADPSSQSVISGVPFSTGAVVSSAYDAGKAGVKKIWTSFVLDAFIPTGATVKVEVSLDGGGTWVGFSPSWTIIGIGVRGEWTGIIHGLSFYSIAFRLTLTSVGDGASPWVYSVNVGYVLWSTKSWQWDCTLVLASHVDVLDQSGVDWVVDESLDARRAAFEGWYRAGVPISFTDIDGVTYQSVLITDYAFSAVSSDMPIEGEVRVSLLEIYGS